MKGHLFRPAAASDLEAIHRWYEGERPGLGDEFLTEARRAVEAVVVLPEVYPVIHRDTRRALIFVGCFHTSRDPVSWKRRK